MTYNPLIAIDIGACNTKILGILPSSGGYAGQQIFHKCLTTTTYKPEQLTFSGGSKQYLLSPNQYSILYDKAAATMEIKRGGVSRREDPYDDSYFGIFFASIAEMREEMGLWGDEMYIDLGLGFPHQHKEIANEISKVLLRKKPWTVQLAGKKPFQLTIQHLYTNTQGYFFGVDQIIQLLNGSPSTDRWSKFRGDGAVLFAGFGSNTFELKRVGYSLQDAPEESYSSGSFDLLAELQALVFPKIRKSLTHYELIHRVFLERHYKEHDFNREIAGLIKKKMPEYVGQIAQFLKTYGDCEQMVAGGGLVIHGGQEIISSCSYLFDKWVSIAIDDLGHASPVECFVRGILKQLIINSLRGWK